MAFFLWEGCNTAHTGYRIQWVFSYRIPGYRCPLAARDRSIWLPSLSLCLSRFAVSFSEAQLRPSTQLQREHVPARVLSSLVITRVVTFAGMSPCLLFPGFGFVEFGSVYTKLGPFERNLAHLWFCLCSSGAQTSASLSARIFSLVSAASVFSGNFLLLRL
jgi:hypothetical protein